MIKYTKHFLKKIEDLFKELEYTVRYERGNFKSGYCIVEDKQIAVINRFFEVEARINVLLEILGTVDIDPSKLDDKNATLFKQLKAFAAGNAEEAEAEKVEIEKTETTATDTIEESSELTVEAEPTITDAETTVASEPQIESEV